MKRIDISINSTIPSLSNWLNPNYEGPISEFDYNELDANVNLPNNCLEDFPIFNYKLTPLVKLLTTTLSKSTGNISITLPGANAEFVDSTWIDFYNIFEDYLPTFSIKKNTPKKTDDKVTRKPTLTKYMRITSGKVLKSFHLNCTNSTISALNHYIRTKFAYAWEWTAVPANSLKNIIIPSKSDDAFDDNQTITGVYHGIDMDDDFTNINNIRSLDFEVNLFTTSQASPIQLISSIVCMSKMLSKDGTAILQIQFTADNATIMINCILLLTSIFKKVEFVQLHDTYLYCREFKGLSKIYLERLIKILTYVRGISNTLPNLFIKSEISTALIAKMSLIFSQLTANPIIPTVHELKPYHRIFKYD